MPLGASLGVASRIEGQKKQLQSLTRNVKQYVWIHETTWFLVSVLFAGDHSM
jgi:hypothetical protein